MITFFVLLSAATWMAALVGLLLAMQSLRELIAHCQLHHARDWQELTGGSRTLRLLISWWLLAVPAWLAVDARVATSVLRLRAARWLLVLAGVGLVVGGGAALAGLVE